MLTLDELFDAWDVDPVFRLHDRHTCVGCGRNHLAESVDSYPKAFRDEDADVWCRDCVEEWRGDGLNSDEYVLLRRQSAPPASCADCGVQLRGGSYASFLDEVDGDPRLYCVSCTSKWMHDADTDDEWDADDDADGEDEWDGDGADDGGSELWCAECDVELGGEPYVVDPSEAGADDPACYCMTCWLPPVEAVAADSGAAAAEAANAARNKANIEKLRERFPGCCSHQLYYVHVRGKAERGCKYGDAEKCERGSHAAPIGLVQKTRDLDLDFA